MKLFIIILFIFFISFILGYAVACILYTSKKSDEKQILQQLSPLSEIHEQRKIKELQNKLKDTELKVSYYITIINQIENEMKKQQFNSVTNLINKIKTIISPEDNYNMKKRKELTKNATNEND